VTTTYISLFLNMADEDATPAPGSDLRRAVNASITSMTSSTFVSASKKIINSKKAAASGGGSASLPAPPPLSRIGSSDSNNRSGERCSRLIPSYYFTWRGYFFCYCCHCHCCSWHSVESINTGGRGVGHGPSAASASSSSSSISREVRLKPKAELNYEGFILLHGVLYKLLHHRKTVGAFSVHKCVRVFVILNRFRR
jgi:hypothetical protein